MESAEDPTGVDVGKCRQRRRQHQCFNHLFDDQLFYIKNERISIEIERIVIEKAM